MPQLTLKISKNVDISAINFKELFTAIHHELETAPKMDVKTAHSGVIHEDYSYIGFGDEAATKIYLELMWLETAERIAMKADLGKRLIHVLETMLTPELKKQNLNCKPRVRIANLGTIDVDYHISK